MSGADAGNNSAEHISGTAASSGSSASKPMAKNAPGNRSDVGWQHGISVDGDAKKIKCKYCEKVITGGIYRLKHHLAGTNKDVGACRAVSDEVRKEMLGILVGLQEKSIKKSNSYTSASEEQMPILGEKRMSQEMGPPQISRDLFKRRGVSTQTTINAIFKKDLREEACPAVASFIYNNVIPFNVVNSEEYHEMFEKVARHGIGFKPPSYHEIRVKYLKLKVDTTRDMLEEHKACWRKNGCTIMTDGWTDKRRRTILKFLVNSSKGTVFLKSIDASHISKTAEIFFKLMDEVVEEVGEENIVQIVTDNAANYKVAGEILMAKRKKLYWTHCAAHCIDLMLEDFDKKIPIHKETIAEGKKITTYIYSRTSLISLLHNFTKGTDLIRPAMTRFATSYLTLGCLLDNKRALIRMFTSDQWSSGQSGKTKDGKFVENLVLDKEFWKNVVICLRGAYPLIKVLRLVDSDEKPAMGFIYEEMDRAKEKIASAFNGVESSYMPLWEIVDQRWDKQLHRPLHAAGYFLNPMLHYGPNFDDCFEVRRGLYECLERMVGDIETMSKIDAQFEAFKNRKQFFGSSIAKAALQTKTPAQWWDSYGFEHPELQQFAIRILSLTCSSSGCERNWSAFEMVHTKKRNRLKQKTMNDVVFVMTNSKLAKNKQPRKPNEFKFDIDELSSDDEWIVEGGDVDSNFDLDIPNEENTIEVGQSSSGNVGDCTRPQDDLEIPIFDDGDDIFEEGRDEFVDNDDYDPTSLNDLL